MHHYYKSGCRNVADAVALTQLLAGGTRDVTTPVNMLYSISLVKLFLDAVSYNDNFNN